MTESQAVRHQAAGTTARLLLAVGWFVFGCLLLLPDVPPGIVISPDTSAHLMMARSCLAGDGCMGDLGPTSVLGVAHGTGWLSFLMLHQLAGGTPDQLPVVLAVIDALAFSLVCLTAAWMWGISAGLLAGLLLAGAWLSVPFLRLDMLSGTVWNPSLSPLFGAALSGAALLALKSRRPGHALLAAVLGGAAATVHLASGVLAMPVLLVLAIAQPACRRLGLSILLALAFLGTVQLLSPAMPVETGVLYGLFGNPGTVWSSSSGQTGWLVGLLGLIGGLCLLFALLAIRPSAASRSGTPDRATSSLYLVVCAVTSIFLLRDQQASTSLQGVGPALVLAILAAAGSVLAIVAGRSAGHTVRLRKLLTGGSYILAAVVAALLVVGRLDRPDDSDAGERSDEGRIGYAAAERIVRDVAVRHFRSFDEFALATGVAGGVELIQEAALVYWPDPRVDQTGPPFPAGQVALTIVPADPGTEPLPEGWRLVEVSGGGRVAVHSYRPVVDPSSAWYCRYNPGADECHCLSAAEVACPAVSDPAAYPLRWECLYRSRSTVLVEPEGYDGYLIGHFSSTSSDVDRRLAVPALEMSGECPGWLIETTGVEPGLLPAISAPVPGGTGAGRVVAWWPGDDGYCAWRLDMRFLPRLVEIDPKAGPLPGRLSERLEVTVPAPAGSPRSLPPACEAVLAATAGQIPAPPVRYGDILLPRWYGLGSALLLAGGTLAAVGYLLFVFLMSSCVPGGVRAPARRSRSRESSG